MKYNLLKKLAVLPAALMLLSFNPAAALADEYTQNADTTVVTEKPSAPGAASSETFTGAVRHQSLFGTTADSTYTGSYVFFPAGGRSFWHTHPGGQRLVVIKGVCWTGTESGGKSIAKAGDTIWCPPGVKHWHGASPDGEMVHLALTEVRDGKNVTWLEEVTNEQYYAE